MKVFLAFQEIDVIEDFTNPKSNIKAFTQALNTDHKPQSWTPTLTLSPIPILDAYPEVQPLPEPILNFNNKL